MLRSVALPEPAASAREISAQLCRKISAAIDSNHGVLPFDEFMRMALYEPGLGYYMNGTIKFGREGDFVTAPELSPLFGRCVARVAADVLKQTGGEILEFGGGSGAMAVSILAHLQELGELPQKYYLLELSGELRERQAATIKDALPDCFKRVEWLDAPPTAFDGFVIANEVLDALPCKRFRIAEQKVFEQQVTHDAGRFGWRNTAADAALAATIAARIGRGWQQLPDPFLSELNGSMPAWVADLARCLRKAVVLIFDYGFPAYEYYHGERNAGTLLCHFRQRAHDDPFFHPGLQDITASVDFSHVAECADDSGLQVAGYTRQNQFLMASGLLDDVTALSQSADARAIERYAFETKLLTMPNEMGDRFKCMALSKNYNSRLPAFQFRDERHRL